MNPLNKPAPRWYRLTRKIWSSVENLVIAILLITGHTESSLALLIFKISSSFVKDTLDSIMVSESEDYVKI